MSTERAEIIVIGGGAVGCGVAYSLARAGHTDVLLLEREPTLAAATSSQAAGLVGQLRTSLERTQLAMWSVKTFRELQKDTTSPPAWREVGSLRIALNEERVHEFQRMLDIAHQAGLEADFIDQDRATQLWPYLNFSRAQSILWCPSDGYLQPYDLTMAYATQARRLGVRIETHACVDRILINQGRACGVQVNQRTIESRWVINAAGAHAYHLAQQVGLDLPIVPVRHEFFVTIPSPQLHPELPVIRIPDSTLYLRAETNALLCGGWEPQALSLAPHSFPLETPPPRVTEDWDVLAWFAEQLSPEFPQVNDLGIRSVFKGWPTFTPDGRFIIGESARVPGFVMAGGCNAHGVSGSAGIGRHVLEAMFNPDPSPYVRSLSPDRFAHNTWTWESAVRDAQRHYETYYAL